MHIKYGAKREDVITDLEQRIKDGESTVCYTFQDGDTFGAKCLECGVISTRAHQNGTNCWVYIPEEGLRSEEICRDCQKKMEGRAFKVQLTTKQRLREWRYKFLRSIAEKITFASMYPHEREAILFKKSYDEKISDFQEPEFDPDFIPGSFTNK